MSSVRAAMRAFARDSGMLCHTLFTNRRTESHDILRKLRKQQYPAYIETPADGVLFNWPSAAACWSFITAGEIEANALAISGNWTVITSYTLLDEHEKLPSFDEVLDYIASLQRRGFDIPGDGNLERDVLFNMYPPEIAERSLALMSMLTPAEFLLHYYHRLAKNSRIHVNHVAFNPKRGPTIANSSKIVIDDAARLVYLPNLGAHFGATRKNFFVPDVHAAYQDLANREMGSPLPGLGGWLIDLDTWEKTTPTLMRQFGD
jgi:hypothetical protein